MRKFDYSFLKTISLDVSLVNTISRVETLKERDANRIIPFQRTYRGMEAAARIQSVFGSNAIEGIFTTDGRLKAICEKKVRPEGHNEAEIAGYRDALDLIHNNHDSMKVDEETILDLHRMMMAYTTDGGGQWKDIDNFIGQYNEDGTIDVHFEPMSAEDTPKAMRQLILAYRLAMQDPAINRLLLMPCFILDFLSIHPFLDGNGRMSRLLTLLLLYKEGYNVGKYVSIEQKIYANISEYYRSLTESSNGWHEGKNDYIPFMRYYLGIVFFCYRELDRRFMTAVGSKENKTERVEYAVLNSLMPVSKRELMKNLPDVSEVMIANVLGRLVKEGRIEKIGAGPNTRYFRKQSEEI